jgi:hypothetical protein
MIQVGVYMLKTDLKACFAAEYKGIPVEVHLKTFQHAMQSSKNLS